VPPRSNRPIRATVGEAGAIREPRSSCGAVLVVDGRADGARLGQEDLPAERARRMLGER